MFDKDCYSPRWTQRTTTYLGAIALGLTALLVPGCNGGEEIEEGRTNVTSEEVAEVSPGAPTVGQEVTIRSEATEAVGESGFVLQPQDGQAILAINSTGTPFVLPSANIPIQATGRVEQFVIADVEREYGLDLENELYVDYENQPVIIAESLALAPTPEDLAEAPTNYFDKTIAVEGEVRVLEGADNAFALFEDGWVDDIGVLVIGTNPNEQLLGSAVSEGEQVVVTGTTRNVDTLAQEAERLGWDQNKIAEFQQRYTNRPIILATEVYPSAVDNK